MGNRKPRENRLIENLSVIDIAEEGKGVAKADELVLFIDKAIPGDVVDVSLYRKKKNFGEASIVAIRQASPYRTEAFCQHFGTCGGCKWQHMDYAAQLIYKQKSVENALSRIGKVDIEPMESILPSAQTRYYRNKLEYTFSNKRWLTAADVSSGEQHEDMDALGFHVPLRFDKILDIDHCYLQADPSNAIRNGLRDFTKQHAISYYDLRRHSGALRNLMIRTSTTGDLMVVVVFAYPTEEEIDLVMEYLKEGFPAITSLQYIVNQKKNDTIFDQEIVCYHGAEDHIFEQMGDLRFKIGAKSFYQTNSVQAYELYKIAKDFASFTGNEKVYDLYTGAGTIANFVARDVTEVIGVEYVPSAIEDAYINSEINGIENTKFYAGDMKDVLVPAFIEEHGKPDVVITDPPRAGMHPDVVARLLEMEAPKIVYVSCNAATQARDLALLSEKYMVKRIKPVDMFPHTQHVENVVLLELATDNA
ncbi:23S rRNA (uracil(1939)-C(5))-methyltransferase RlmD [Olivibacter sitiensis]|uniref:23S rRNA (uracil(1939)-C(5))-methyltransferase RlmD n=1 Tax=Olivibacter sitiensis TaxID=376470 RepID=UPI000485EDF1|nr:23S rRNA (uracil(1939)-C(5))-methyltransferase RlmD [Olivibacter sitiensis]